MVSTRSQVGEQRLEKVMACTDLMTLLLQFEMADMKQRGEEEIWATRQKNEDDPRILREQNEQNLRTLKQENEKMKKKLLGDKAEKTKVITISGRSKVNTTNPIKEDEVSY